MTIALRRAAALVGTTTIALSLLAVSAAPASAASPEDAYTASITNGGLYTTDVATGDSALLSGVVANISGLDVDGATGRGYAVDFNANGATSSLFAVDLPEGTVTRVGAITFPNGQPVLGCNGVDLTAGVVTIACDGAVLYGPSQVGTINPATAVFTPMVTIPRLTSVAKNPVDGLLYGFEIGTVGNTNAYTIDLAAGTYTDLGIYVLSGPTPGFFTGNAYLGGADFDSDGVLWGTAYNTMDFTGRPNSHLLSGTPLALSQVSRLEDARAADIHSESLSLITPAAVVPPVVPIEPVVTPELVPAAIAAPTAVLAATGVDLAPAALMAGLALLLGLTLLLTRRRAAR